MPEAIRLIDKIQDMSDFNGDSFVDGQFMVWDAANQRFTSTEFITQSDGITITAGAGRTALVVNGGDVDFGGGKHCLSSNGLIHLFGLGNPDATDKEQLQLGWDTTTSTYKIQTRKSGSGVLRNCTSTPMAPLFNNSQVRQTIFWNSRILLVLFSRMLLLLVCSMVMAVVLQILRQPTLMVLCLLRMAVQVR
jgi:hypothetical protein